MDDRSDEKDNTAEAPTQTSPAKPLAEGRVDLDDMPTCACGHTRYHHRVVGFPHYSLWKRFLMVAGMSSKPRRTDFKCRDCGQVFDFESEEQRLHRKV